MSKRYYASLRPPMVCQTVHPVLSTGLYTGLPIEHCLPILSTGFSFWVVRHCRREKNVPMDVITSVIQYLLVPGITAFALYKLIALAFGDADLYTLSLKKVPERAFKGRVVWITGASQGLGELLAQTLFAQGALLILSARREDQLQRVANKLGDQGRVLVLPVDLTAGEAELSAAVEKVQLAKPVGIAAL
eukprot:2250549-Pyramimonas_sp.AAC.1